MVFDAVLINFTILRSYDSVVVTWLAHIMLTLSRMKIGLLVSSLSLLSGCSSRGPGSPVDAPEVDPQASHASAVTCANWPTCYSQTQVTWRSDLTDHVIASAKYAFCALQGVVDTFSQLPDVYGHLGRVVLYVDENYNWAIDTIAGGGLPPGYLGAALVGCIPYSTLGIYGSYQPPYQFSGPYGLLPQPGQYVSYTPVQYGGFCSISEIWGSVTSLSDYIVIGTPPMTCGPNCWGSDAGNDASHVDRSVYGMICANWGNYQAPPKLSGLYAVTPTVHSVQLPDVNSGFCGLIFMQGGFASATRNSSVLITSDSYGNQYLSNTNGGGNAMYPYAQAYCLMY